jgi:DNA-binding MarR family transcriptional regulator
MTDPANTTDAEPPTLGEATGQLDSLVHHPVRLGILTVVAAVERCTFAYLKDTLEVTDGNLSRNVTALEQAGLVEVEKGYEGRRPRTWVSATLAGREALTRHLAALQALTSWSPEPPAAD